MTIEEAILSVRNEARAENMPVLREKTAEALYALAKEVNVKRALDVGTNLGVSCLTLLLAGAESVTTLEKEEEIAERARANFASCGAAGRVSILVGDCNETLRYLEGNEYDVVVLDGPKSTLKAQYETCLAMVKKGGAIFIDDVAYHGMIAEEGAKHKQRTIIVGMRAFLQELGQDDRVTARIYQEEDGYAVVRKK